MLSLTPDQMHIRNVALRLIEKLGKDEPGQPPEAPEDKKLMEDAVKVIANAFIDLNRAANAMEAIATFMANDIQARQQKSSIIKPGG